MGIAHRLRWPDPNESATLPKTVLGPTPGYEHNYGYGESINFVPFTWNTYRMQHMLTITLLDPNYWFLGCSCGISYMGRLSFKEPNSRICKRAKAKWKQSVDQMFAELMRRHKIAEDNFNNWFNPLNS